jgi:hypothetical protein
MNILKFLMLIAFADHGGPLSKALNVFARSNTGIVGSNK